jgi:ribosomal protein L4
MKSALSAKAKEGKLIIVDDCEAKEAQDEADGAAQLEEIGH